MEEGEVGFVGDDGVVFARESRACVWGRRVKGQGQSLTEVGVVLLYGLVLVGCEGVGPDLHMGFGILFGFGF